MLGLRGARKLFLSFWGFAMKFKRKASHMFGIISVVGAMYLPQANATTFAEGLLSPSIDDGLSLISHTSLARNSFTDIFTFSLNQTVDFNAAVTAPMVTFTGAPGFGTNITSGVNLLNLQLWKTDGAGNKLGSSPLDDAAFDGNVFYTRLSPTGSRYNVSLSSNDVTLNAGHYELVVDGFSSFRNASYAGFISVSAVPEPAEWLMMLLGLPMTLWAVRRQQAENVVRVAV